MRTLFSLLVFCLLGSSVRAADLLVISDIDDTLKNSHVLAPIGRIGRGAVIDDAFPQMSELLNALAAQGARILYVSAAPETLMGALHRAFLYENQFPDGLLYLSPTWVRAGDKSVILRRLLAEEKPKTVIFLGDNGEHDPLVYASLALENPEIQFHTFIRWAYPTNVGSAFYEGQVPFVTAGEIALSLFQSGVLLPGPTAALVKNSVNRDLVSEINDWLEPGAALGLPEWVDCRGINSQTPQVPDWQEDLNILFTKIQQRCAD